MLLVRYIRPTPIVTSQRTLLITNNIAYYYIINRKTGSPYVCYSHMFPINRKCIGLFRIKLTLSTRGSETVEGKRIISLSFPVFTIGATEGGG